MSHRRHWPSASAVGAESWSWLWRQRPRMFRAFPAFLQRPRQAWPCRLFRLSLRRAWPCRVSWVRPIGACIGCLVRTCENMSVRGTRKTSDKRMKRAMTCYDWLLRISFGYQRLWERGLERHPTCGTWNIPTLSLPPFSGFHQIKRFETLLTGLLHAL